MIPRRYISTYKEFDKDLKKWKTDSEFRNNSYRKLFSDKLKEYIGAENIYLVGSGRSTLPLIFESLNLKKDDEIIVSPYNLKALVQIIEEYCKVKFTDIDKETYSITAKTILDKITTKTKAILLTHPFGFCDDIKEIKTICKKNDLILIEDCAHSMGSRYKGKSLGTFGDFALLSFDYIKPLSTLGGGALILNNNKYKSKIEKLYREFQEPKKKGVQKKISYYYLQKILINTKLFFFVKLLLDAQWLHDILMKIHQGQTTITKSKLSQIQSMIGYKSLNKLETKLHKNKIYHKLFIDNLPKQYHKWLQKGFNSDLSYYFLTYNTNGRSRIFRKMLAKEKIDVGTENEIMDLCESSFSNSKKIHDSLIQLPLYPELKINDIKRITNAIISIETKLK